MWSFARSAVRAHRASFVGSFLIVVAAAALLSANGVLMESGLRGDAPLLTTIAGSFAGTAVLVVVLVVASTFASALRQRSEQFALLRAVGATPAQVRRMVTAEVALVFAYAAPLGAVPGLFAAHLLTPSLESGGIVPEGLTLVVTPLPAVGALLLLFPTALLAARLAARKVTTVSPTAAVRGSSAEPAGLTGARRVWALVLLFSGIAQAGMPFVMPGTVGSAAGATSAFLLISAAAVAGPALVSTAARRAVSASRSSRHAATLLALLNSRGFSRRLTTAIVPLALFLALGTVQTGVNGSMVDAAQVQLRAGLSADAVLISPDGVSAAQASDVASAPGTEAVLASSMVPAEVRVDPADEVGDLAWEQAGLRAVSGSVPELFDVGVTAGSLDDLAGPGTIAVSGESLFATGKGVGDTVDLRFDDGTALSPTIVAVYDRGLGFGDYLLDAATLPEDAPVDTLFVRGQADLSGLTGLAGAQVLTVDEYVTEAVDGAASQQELGTILLFVLILFVAVAAANTLVMLTSARRPELALLRRIGTTRRQLTSMITVESVFVMVSALVLGTLSVIPALVSVSYGMVGGFAPAVDWPVYGALAAAVVLIAVVAMVLPARLASRGRA
ncbi:FtsX-like permease family protein [Promicromonospora thailandica]|uniref:ABC transport system permease protein n=1 Tax=Promicromonospora thailandica TaxID=765201 RepID=A0A9X2JSQ4_9MICO|nr:ABC transporter permease [Promicromonospora thailandica]MCP2262755.1 putative ABC transport system permease protein [Promicromonospora thailandica]